MIPFHHTRSTNSGDSRMSILRQVDRVTLSKNSQSIKRGLSIQDQLICWSLWQEILCGSLRSYHQ